MKFWVTYPMVKGSSADNEVAQPYDPALVTPEGVTRFCQATEAAGFAGVGFTDHPAPSHDWWSTGGHDALDPLIALTYVAAVTERIRLIPNILILPYRNPFVVAKAAATLDALSGGRFTFAVATGYMRGEYEAVGVDFDQRNPLFDEAVEVIKGIWSEDNYAKEGTTFSAKGQTSNPKPDPHPPIWVGGNSRLSRRRVARYGDGWSPFPASEALSKSAKTPVLRTVDDLRIALDDLWQLMDEAGRDRSEIDVAFASRAGGNPALDSFNPEAELEAAAEMEKLGVTWLNIFIPGDSINESIEAVQRFGETVIR